MIKNIQCTFFLLPFFFCSFLFAQDSIPDKNKKVLEYVNTQIGKKVKSGQCFYLAAGALDIVSPGWQKRQKRKGLFSNTYEYVYGKRISKRKLLPGDFILYEWKFADSKGKKRTSHICVVYSIDKNGNIKVAEQNTEGTLKKSVVEINNFDITGQDLGIKICKLRFYRPY